MAKSVTGESTSMSTPTPTPAPFSPQTRAALLAEFAAARDARDVSRGREIYREAAAHDAAHPGEPSLLDQLIGVHVEALLRVVA